MAPVLTIGHGGRTVSEMLTLLESAGVEYLVDVRTQPVSRYQPEFSQDQLKRLLAGSSFRYLFMGPELGGRPDPPECYVDGRVSYDIVRTMPFFRSGIDRLERAVAQGYRLCLLCSERKPESCHRSKLIAAVLIERGVQVQHIDEEDHICEHAEVLARIDSGQETLFGRTMSSRKRYRRRD